MTLYNNTGNEVYYGISSASSGDCGTIEAGGTADWPGYDNQENVTVAFTPTPVGQQASPFTVNIPESGTGMAVTIGLYQE